MRRAEGVQGSWTLRQVQKKSFPPHQRLQVRRLIWREHVNQTSTSDSLTTHAPSRPQSLLWSKGKNQHADGTGVTTRRGKIARGPSMAFHVSMRSLSSMPVVSDEYMREAEMSGIRFSSVGSRLYMTGLIGAMPGAGMSIVVPSPRVRRLCCVVGRCVCSAGQGE